MKKALFIVSLCFSVIVLSFMPLLIITASVIDFSDPDGIKLEKIHNYILSYEPKDDGFIDLWQHPFHTAIRGGGDCEDLALLEWTLLKFAGVDASLVYGKLNNKGHIWVEYQGRILESTGLEPALPRLGEDLQVLIYIPIFRIGGSD